MSNIDIILRTIGKGNDSIQSVIDELFPELFPSQSRNADTSDYGLLEQWETEFDVTPSAGATLADRRLVLLGKVRALGLDDFAAFYSIASGLGYNIGSHTAGDPHLTITDGDYPAFRAGISAAGIDKVWDQNQGFSSVTWCVRGTDVESDLNLQAIFAVLKAVGTEIKYINE